MNQVFFSPFTKQYLGVEISAKMNALKGGLERLSVADKTFSLPLIAFSRTFNKGAQPFQDFKDIVSIRNAATHGNIDVSPEAAITNMKTRKIVFPPLSYGLQPSWQDDVSTIEAIRWCINIIARLEESLISFQPSSCHLRPWFPTISDHDAAIQIEALFTGE